MRNSITNEELTHIIGGTEEEESYTLAPAYCPLCKKPQFFRFWGEHNARCTVCGAIHDDRVVLKLYRAYQEGLLNKN